MGSGTQTRIPTFKISASGQNSLKPQAILKELGPRLELKIPEFAQVLSKQAKKMKSFKLVKLWTGWTYENCGLGPCFG